MSESPGGRLCRVESQKEVQRGGDPFVKKRSR